MGIWQVGDEVNSIGIEDQTLIAKKAGQNIEILYQPEIVSGRRDKDNINHVRADFPFIILSVSSTLDDSVF